MKKFLIFLFLIVICFTAGVVYYGTSEFGTYKHIPTPEERAQKRKIITGIMTITSPSFTSNQPLPRKYSCKGENISPPLEFKNIPEHTKSLALIMDDPDAPMGTFVHWVVYNIPPNVQNTNEGTPPPGGHEGLNSAGQKGYTGPCPPSGTHHYHFKLYSLDIMLQLQDEPDKEAVEKYMQGHIISQTELVGLFTH